MVKSRNKLSAADNQQETGIVMSGTLDGQGITRDCIRQAKNVFQGAYRKLAPLAQQETLSPEDLVVVKGALSEILAFNDVIHHWNDIATSGSSETTRDIPQQ